MKHLIYDWIYALIGFLIMLGVLVGIGINQPRGTSVKMWCYGYLAIAVVFDLLVVLALVNGAQYAWLTDLCWGSQQVPPQGWRFMWRITYPKRANDEQGKAGTKEKIFGF